MLASKIKNYIKISGLKFCAIAKVVDIPTNTFSDMVNGKRRITAEEYFKICNALGVDVSFFTQNNEKSA